MQLELEKIQAYLETRFGDKVEIETVQQLGSELSGDEALKQFGYGNPILVSLNFNEKPLRLVFHRIKKNAFGRERDSDRVAAVWLDYNTFNLLPRHVRAEDMVIHNKQGQLKSIQDADDLLLVTSYTPGQPYAQDLTRIRDQGKLQAIDIQRVEVLATYLSNIHETRHNDPNLWRRRLRDLIGHGEGIIGLTDNYPLDNDFTTGNEMRIIEEAANRWRWQLKPLHHRLCQVHGDFHPFNVLFSEGLDFHVLDRSRGEWGEPADDVSCMTINYLFFSLQRNNDLDGPFLELHTLFWETYFKNRSDNELLEVIQPWFAWRALVISSPVWYPTISDSVRRKILNFARRVMSTDRYDYHDVNQYLEDLH